MNQLPTTKRQKKRNAQRVRRLAKKPNQTVRKTRINDPTKCASVVRLTASEHLLNVLQDLYKNKHCFEEEYER